MFGATKRGTRSPNDCLFERIKLFAPCEVDLFVDFPSSVVQGGKRAHEYIEVRRVCNSTPTSSLPKNENIQSEVLLSVRCIFKMEASR